MSFARHKEIVNMPNHLRLYRPFRLLVAAATAVALLMVLAASSASAAETKTFTGVKGCRPPISLITPPAQGGYCVITESSLKILEGAKVYYIAATLIAGVLDSPVMLVATDERASTATGHCTYHFATLSGLCVYTGGTGKLDGFNATVIVGPPTAPGSGVFPITGTYSFDRDQHDD
jgi:hypothetical protein